MSGGKLDNRVLTTSSKEDVYKILQSQNLGILAEYLKNNIRRAQYLEKTTVGKNEKVDPLYTHIDAVKLHQNNEKEQVKRIIQDCRNNFLLFSEQELLSSSKKVGGDEKLNKKYFTSLGKSGDEKVYISNVAAEKERFFVEYSVLQAVLEQLTRSGKIGKTGDVISQAVYYYEILRNSGQGLNNSFFQKPYCQYIKRQI